MEYDRKIQKWELGRHKVDRMVWWRIDILIESEQTTTEERERDIYSERSDNLGQWEWDDQ